MSRLRSTFCAVFGLSLLMGFAGAGCSSRPAAKSTAAQDSVNVPAPDAGTDAVPQPAVEDRSGEPSAAPPAPIVENTDNSISPPVPPVTAPAPEVAENATPPAPSTPPPPVETTVPADMNSSGETPALSGSYTVRSGDTLMKIAFDTYGDLFKWREIYEANKDRISDPNSVPPGTVLKLEKPATTVAISRNGSQYLIRHGDTLGTISTDVYGTRGKWKRLWENNPQLIHDPNRIYAGFYLYYTLTPQEREEYKRRKGIEPEEPTVSPAPLAQAPVQAPAVPAVATHRDPASVLPPSIEPPKMDPTALEPVPVAPSAHIAPPPAEHSADLNEVVQKAQKEEATAAIPAAAGP